MVVALVHCRLGRRLRLGGWRASIRSVDNVTSAESLAVSIDSRGEVGSMEVGGMEDAKGEADGEVAGSGVGRRSPAVDNVGSST
jgi:hypothetical protein